MEFKDTLFSFIPTVLEIDGFCVEIDAAISKKDGVPLENADLKQLSQANDRHIWIVLGGGIYRVPHLLVNLRQIMKTGFSSSCFLTRYFSLLSLVRVEAEFFHPNQPKPPTTAVFCLMQQCFKLELFCL